MSELHNEIPATWELRSCFTKRQKSRRWVSPQLYVIAGLISWQPFIRQNDKGLEALVEIIFLSPPALPGTLPPTEKVPSSCLGHLLFEAISLAKPFFGSTSILLRLVLLNGACLRHQAARSINQQVNCLYVEVYWVWDPYTHVYLTYTCIN
jgi:hypothetical protein